MTSSRPWARISRPSLWERASRTTQTLLDQVKVILDDSVVDIGPREAQWITEAADDEGAALDMARRRSKGEPLQYVLGNAHFRKIVLSVGPGVFIPRPETELLVEKALELLPHGGRVVDLGTGSGAIALSIAYERPDADVYATEADTGAYPWAVRNRDELALSAEIIEGDLFEGLPEELKGTFDVVVSNPPYVATSRREILPIDVRDHEPEKALYGGGDGMLVTTRVAQEARSWLKPGGWLALEMSVEQQQDMTTLLAGLDYRNVKIGIDLAEWPRLVVAQVPG
ncbi:MAG: release factor glutamine methyltransferase [Actinomycetota bacterium]|nr:release factor glutamine methyltransferase [Actinomycetota bacterium]